MEHDNAKSKTNAKRAQKKNEDKRERKKCARHSGESLLANMCSRASESVVCRTLEKLTWRENVAPGSVWWWVMGWDGTRWQMPFLFAILQLCTHFNCRSIKQEARDHPPSSEPQASDGIHKRIFLLIIKFVSRVFSVVGTCKVLLWCRRRLIMNEDIQQMNSNWFRRIRPKSNCRWIHLIEWRIWITSIPHQGAPPFFWTSAFFVLAHNSGVDVLQTCFSFHFDVDDRIAKSANYRSHWALRAEGIGKVM